MTLLKDLLNCSSVHGIPQARIWKIIGKNQLLVKMDKIIICSWHHIEFDYSITHNSIKNYNLFNYTKILFENNLFLQDDQCGIGKLKQMFQFSLKQKMEKWKQVSVTTEEEPC